MPKIFVISDLHFGHENIIKLADRPFLNVDEMDRILIENWNKTVGKTDYVYIVGDFAFKGKSVSYYAEKLNGFKILIKGNHDKIKECDKKHFVKITDYYELRIGEQLYVLTHYPMTAWNGAFRNSIQLYGHVHKTGKVWETPQLPNTYNVCCEFHKYTPVEITTFKVKNFVKEMNL